MYSTLNMAISLPNSSLVELERVLRQELLLFPQQKAKKSVITPKKLQLVEYETTRSTAIRGRSFTKMRNEKIVFSSRWG